MINRLVSGFIVTSFGLCFSALMAEVTAAVKESML